MSLGNTVTVVKNENLVIVSTPGPMGPAGADGAPGDDGGGGDVVGPASAVSGNLPMFSGTTGKLLSDSGTSVDYLTNLILNREVTGVAATLVSNHAALASGVHGISAFAATLLDDANAAAFRTTLGLGTAATSNTTAFEASGAITTHAAITSGVHGISAFAATLLDDANASAFITTLFGGATGTGNAVRASSPTLVTPTLGVASATSLAVGAGSVSAPSVSVGDLNSGIYSHLAGGLSIAADGVQAVRIQPDVSVAFYGPYALFSYDLILGASADLSIARVGISAAGVWNYASPSSPTSFYVYNVAGTDYERGVFDWQTTADTLTIGTQKGGAGSARELQFVVGGGAARLRIDISGNSFFQGAITVGANVSIADDFAFYWSSRSLIWSPSDGVVRFSNNANSDFDRLQFGGITSSFPSLKRRTATLEARLADDSAITTLVGAMVLKAGAVSDTDFTNPVDGCHGFDTTNFKHYVRVGGAWKSSAAYT